MNKKRKHEVYNIGYGDYRLVPVSEAVAYMAASKARTFITGCREPTEGQVAFRMKMLSKGAK